MAATYSRSWPPLSCARLDGCAVPDAGGPRGSRLSIVVPAKAGTHTPVRHRLSSDCGSRLSLALGRDDSGEVNRKAKANALLAPVLCLGAGIRPSSAVFPSPEMRGMARRKAHG